MFQFASDSGVPLAAETVFTIGGFNLTNSMLLGLLISVGLSIIFLLAAKYISVRPKSKFAFFVESAIEFVTSQLRTTMGGDEQKARKFLPLFAALFFFILLNNLIGLFPAMGGTVYVINDEGIKAALLRPFTTDLNGTLALAIISIGTVQYFAIKQRGGWGHLKHYYSMMQPWWNPMNFFIGSIEILGELIRLLTLALRLFGVIYAGEVLLHVITNLTGNLSPIAIIPVIFMEIFFSVIQAYLFLMLASTYLAIGTSNDGHDEPSHESHTTIDSQKVAKAPV
jgi:F-type H+-transporting ATPase subunit a